MININIDLISKIYNILQPYCVAIYLGGSHCQSYIKNPHDIDIICFSDTFENHRELTYHLNVYLSHHKEDNIYDFIQTRDEDNEEHSYGSYIHRDMIKLIGRDINFTFDILGKDRLEYINILLDTIDKLNRRYIRNQKRWYQVMRGYYLLKNNSYELTEEQIDIINKIHDQEEGWDTYIVDIEKNLLEMQKEYNK